MSPSASWLRLLTSLRKSTAPPLRAVHGMRHLVNKGICCAVHSHRHLEIVYHDTGAGRTRLPGGKEIAFAEGGVIIYAPEQGHDQVMDGRGEDACLQIEMPAALRTGLKGCLYLPPPLDSLIVAEMKSLTSGHIRPEPSAQTVMHLRATAILLSLLQAASSRVDQDAMPRKERHVSQAESYLRDHFQGLGSLDEVARHVGISQDRLRHLFREQRGISMIRFLSQLRLERARSLLTHARLPLKQIAALSGFRDEYYFSAVFRRFHHLSPGAYRERGRISKPETAKV